MTAFFYRARMLFPTFGIVRDLFVHSSAEEDPHRPSDRNKILSKRNINVACTEYFHEPFARLIPSETAHNGSDRTEHGANKWALCFARGNAGAR